MTALSYLLVVGHYSGSTVNLELLPQVRYLVANLMYRCVNEQQDRAAEGRWHSMLHQWLDATGHLLFRQDDSIPIGALRLLEEGFILPLTRDQCRALLQAAQNFFLKQQEGSAEFTTIEEGEPPHMAVNQQHPQTPQPDYLVILRLTATVPECVAAEVLGIDSDQIQSCLVSCEGWEDLRSNLGENYLLIKFHRDLVLQEGGTQISQEVALRMMDCFVSPSEVFDLPGKEERVAAFAGRHRGYRKIRLKDPVLRRAAGN